MLKAWRFTTAVTTMAVLLSTLAVSPAMPSDNSSSGLPLPLPAPGQEENLPMTTQKATAPRQRNPFGPSSSDRIRQVAFDQLENRAAKPQSKKRGSFFNFGKAKNTTANR